MYHSTKCFLRNHSTLKCLHSTIVPVRKLPYVNYGAFYEMPSTKRSLRCKAYVYVESLLDVYVRTVIFSGKSNTLRERSTSENDSLRNDTLRNALYETQEVYFVYVN